MILDVSQEFFFDAAHTLEREFETDTSRRIHGHTYHAEVTVRGEKNQRTGMVVDLAILRNHIRAVRENLDHRLLDDIAELGIPTLENLSVFIANRLKALEPRVISVRVSRKASGDSCLYQLSLG